jgi:hypothetical protein
MRTTPDPYRGSRFPAEAPGSTTSPRLAEAEPLLERALAIGEESLSPHRPDLAKVRANYAAPLARLGRAAQAAALHAQARAAP